MCIIIDITYTQCGTDRHATKATKCNEHAQGEGEKRERDRVVKESATRRQGEEREEGRQQGKVKRTSFLRQQLDCFVVVAVTVCLFSYSFILHLSFAFSPSLFFSLSPSFSVFLLLFLQLTCLI